MTGTITNEKSRLMFKLALYQVIKKRTLPKVLLKKFHQN